MPFCRGLFITGNLSEQDTQMISASIEDTVYKYILTVDAIKDDIVSGPKKLVIALNIDDGSKSCTVQRVVPQNTDRSRDFLTVTIVAVGSLNSSVIYFLISFRSS